MTTAPTAGTAGLEPAAWAGLAASLLAVWAGGGAGLARPHGVYAMTPQDFTAWVTAICSAIGAATAAANGVAIVVHRWGKRPRKPRRRKGDDAASKAEKPAD